MSSKDDGPDDDYLNYWTATREKEPSFDDGGATPDTPHLNDDTSLEYITGTLIVRVAAARNVEPSSVKVGMGRYLLGTGKPKNTEENIRSYRSYASGSFGAKTSVDSVFAKLRFGRQAQRTGRASEGNGGPIAWSRSETCYFDVVTPVLFESGSDVRDAEIRKDASVETRSVPTRSRPRPILRLSLYRVTSSSSSHEDIENETPVYVTPGVDMTNLITGKLNCLDAWIPLHPKNSKNSTASKSFSDRYSSHNQQPLTPSSSSSFSGAEIRILCEYEHTDPPPHPGDTCYLTPFIHHSHLYPLTPHRTYCVDSLRGDQVILSYISPEGWACTFQVHRCMLLCLKQHDAFLDRHFDTVLDVAGRLIASPMVGSVKTTVRKLGEEGLVGVGSNVVKNGVSVLGRWLGGGVDVAKEDILFATNLKYTKPPNHPSFPPPTNMPRCPITGKQFQDPVIAADGHTYERRIIMQWLESTDTSPITGAVMDHDSLVPNYLLLSAFR